MDDATAHMMMMQQYQQGSLAQLYGQQQMMHLQSQQQAERCSRVHAREVSRSPQLLLLIEDDQ